tara:strand:+ start:223 stop:603 length:381 start_codon:yes stop_codon:yes gene_type:complete
MPVGKPDHTGVHTAIFLEFEKLELARVKIDIRVSRIHTVFDVCKESVYGVLHLLQLIEPLLPWRKPRIPGLYVPECPLEFHQAPYGKRIPMLLRRNLFQLSQGALPVTAVIKQVTEKNTCLIEIGI